MGNKTKGRISRLKRHPRYNKISRAQRVRGLVEHPNRRTEGAMDKDKPLAHDHLRNGVGASVTDGALLPTDDSVRPGISPLNSEPLLDVNLDSQNGIDASPLGIKISNVTSLKAPNDEPEIKTDISQQSTKEESLQQLSTNALPPYSPPPFPPTLQNIQCETYCCTDCGDTFALKSSLTFHLNRKSVKITFLCDACTDVQVFYNRCSLLSHIRAHTDKGEPSDIRNAFIKPISLSEMQKANSSLPSSDEDDISAMDAASPSKLLEVSISEPITEQSVPVDSLESSNIKENIKDPAVVTCSECGKTFENFKSRITHLTNNDKIPVVISQCQRCGILCPSRCNFKAHLRIHMKIKPHVCPECGAVVGQSWDAFFKHMKYECFHFSRSIGYKCSVCNFLMGSSAALQKHTLELHTETYVKCQACPMAFKSVTSFQNHKAAVHSAIEVLHKLIFKCALCDIVFLTKEQMLSHLDFHIKDQVFQYVFNCMECNKAIDSKVALYEHLQISHNKPLETKCNSNDSFLAGEDGSGNLHVKSRCGTNLAHPQKVECILCHCCFVTRQGYNIHNAKVHAQAKQHCSVCGLLAESKYKMIEHGRRHVKRGSLVCLLCNNTEFQDESSLAKHLFKHVETVQFPSYCPLCDVPLYSLGGASNHLRKEHGIKKESDLEVKSELKMGKSSDLPGSSSSSEVRHCRTCKQSFDDWNKWKLHILTEHKLKPEPKNTAKTYPVVVLTPVKPVNTQGNSDGAKRKCSSTFAAKGGTGDKRSDLQQKRMRSSGYCCAKCDFSSEDKVTFKNHILSHKTNKSSFQCQDCGLCFVVESSLRRHLKAIHRIDDTDKYIAEEGANYTPETDTPSESSSHGSLECTVCYTTFPTESSLKTHLRSHGMAFIQAKKTFGSKFSNV